MPTLIFLISTTKQQRISNSWKRCSLKNRKGKGHVVVMNSVVRKKKDTDHRGRWPIIGGNETQQSYGQKGQGPFSARMETAQIFGVGRDLEYMACGDFIAAAVTITATGIRGEVTS